MATLETNGIFPALTISEFESCDRIVYSVSQQKWAVSRIITDGGTLDLSDELAFTPAEISTSAQSTTLVSGTGLPQGIENLFVNGTANCTLRGNAGENVLTGGRGNDTLNGGNGLDTLCGSSGNDTYILNDADRVNESPGGGIDTVRARMTYTLTGEVGNLVLTGTDNISATGNGQENVITGNAGANRIDGGTQADILTGQGGADSFVLPTTPRPSNIDTTADFDPTQDRVLLDRDVVRSPPLGSLAPSAFAVSKGGEAADGQDRIIHDKSTGKLYHDPDGWGTKETQVFAILDRRPRAIRQRFPHRLRGGLRPALTLSV
jgi:Ca2+-binding RTX toxin-like protein